MSQVSPLLGPRPGHNGGTQQTQSLEVGPALRCISCSRLPWDPADRLSSDRVHTQHALLPHLLPCTLLSSLENWVKDKQDWNLGLFPASQSL